LVSCMRDMLGKIALVSLDGHRTFLPVLSSFQAGASLLQFSVQGRLQQSARLGTFRL